MAVNIHITIIELNALHTKRQNLFQELDAVIYLLMDAKHWGLRKSRNVTSLFFFFQAEDGIRVHFVTGVQTCALPISRHQGRLAPKQAGSPTRALPRESRAMRSEERRVGKECRCRWLPYHSKKKA